MLPVDLLWQAPRLEHYSEEEAEKSRAVDVDSAEDARVAALIQSASYLQSLWKYQDRNVQEHTFNIGDLVLRQIQSTSGRHKLMSPWEGPFVVKEVTRPGSFRLAYEDRIEVPNSWNIEHLCQFYPWRLIILCSLCARVLYHDSNFVHRHLPWQNSLLRCDYKII